MTITLGIYDGHTATACLVENGKIIACVSEERLNRIKEYGGFPLLSIKEVLKIGGIKPSDIDGVGVASLIKPLVRKDFYKPSLLKRIFGWGTKILPRNFLRSNLWVNPSVALLKFTRKRRELIKKLRSLGINSKIDFYEHHQVHAASAQLVSWFKNKESLILTCDGSGDAICATVNIGRNNEIERIAEISNYNSIGEFYTRITQFLGMKPLSDEYKVMGLAPYSKEKDGKRTYEIIKNFFKISKKSPMIFENRSGVWKWQYIKKFRDIFFGHRFDNIAWAAQKLLEDVLVNWVRNCIEETGINNVVLSGGVFMNVKANLRILSLKEVKNLFILPSCGDESLPIGTALLEYIKLDGSKKIEALGPIYFGPSYSEDEIKGIIKKGVERKYIVERIDNIDEFVAEEIAKGKIIARFRGRMEWGARALGNRSILADPSRREIVIRINEAIKNRDFWMPFAPTILKEKAHEYLINPKQMKAPYMIIAFDAKERAKKDLIAALHPYDFTCRPQVLEKEWNPSYYKILKTFEKITGIGGILNTSFNLHGDPIVCSPTNAIYTFKNSQLDGLAIENFYIARK